MKNIFTQFNGVETFFLICAVIGAVFVLVRLALLFVGVGHDMDTDLGSGGHDFDAHHADSDMGFKILSLHSLTSFLMMFGLVGLALYRQSHVGTFISMVGASLAGLGSVWIIGKLFLLGIRLQARGTISIDSTVGAQGKVYLNIPENGTGRVLINVRNSLREYDATSSDNQAIPTGKPVRVVWVDGNVLVVEMI